MSDICRRIPPPRRRRGVAAGPNAHSFSDEQSLITYFHRGLEITTTLELVGCFDAFFMTHCIRRHCRRRAECRCRDRALDPATNA